MRFDNLTAAGITVPPSLITAAERYDAAVEALTNIDKVFPDLAEVAAHLIDPDNPDDPRDIITQTAQPHVLANGGPQAPIYRFRPQLLTLVHRAFADTLLAHRPAMLAELAPPLRKAGAALVAHVGKYPAGALSGVVEAGDAPLAAWRDRATFIEPVNVIAAAADDLNQGASIGMGGRIGGYGNTPPLLTVLDIEPRYWDAFRRVGSDWEVVARIAHELGLGDEVWSLVGPDDAAARYRLITDAQAQAQRLADAEAAKVAHSAWEQSPDGKSMADLAERSARDVARLVQHARPRDAA